MLTEKPNGIRPTDYQKVEEVKKDSEDEKIGRELKDKLTTFSAIPKKKYPLPQTSSQEIGWDNEEFHFKPMANVNKTQCKEVQYANSYVTMTRRSPYAAEKNLQAENP